MPLELPSRPSLEYLSKLAKDLQHARTRREPEALARVEAIISRSPNSSVPFRLSLAQFVIAREHGYASWPLLKQRVQFGRVPPADARPLISRTPKEIAAFIFDLANRGDVEALANVAVGRRKILAAREHLLREDKLSVIVDALLLGVRHHSPKVRYNCAHAMDIFTDARCAEPLASLLHDPVPRVRRIAMHSISCEECKITPLRRRTDEAAFDLVGTVVEMAEHDPSIQVRRHAVWALSTFADERAALSLETVLARDADGAVRRNTAAAIRRMRHR